MATCAQCNRELPDVARYCFACGADRYGQGKNRTDSYAVQPGETVRSLNVITSIMPQANGTMPQTYRFALVLVIAAPVVLMLAGFVSLALVMASVSMPCLYMFYFRDVNEWERPTGVDLLRHHTCVNHHRCSFHAYLDDMASGIRPSSLCVR